MIETREKEINGANYTVTQLPARRAIKLKAKLIKMFGPVLAQLFLVVKKVDKEEYEQKSNIVSAVEILASNLDPVDFETLIVELFAGVRKNGKELLPNVIDTEFAGDLATLYLVALFVLEVNFASFFELLGIGRQFQSPAEEAPQITKKTFKKTSTTN